MLSSDPMSLFGNVDEWVPGAVFRGWVGGCEANAEPVEVKLISGGFVISTTFANIPRGDGHIGFALVCADHDIGSALAVGSAKVTAQDKRGSPVRLHLHGPMLDSIRQSEAAAAMIASDDAAITSGGAFALSPILVPVGLQSADGSAILGGDGYIFLYRGNNNVLDLYSEDPQSFEVQSTAQSWIHIFSGRADRLGRAGITYLQLVIPEKSTGLPQLAPPELRPVTPLFALLESLIVSSPFSKHYPVLRDALGSRDNPPNYLRTDSHLSSYGCLRAFAAILRTLAALSPAHRSEIADLYSHLGSTQSTASREPFSGDVADRLLGIKLFEHTVQPDVKSFTANDDAIGENVISLAPAGEHIGTHIVFRNPTAPVSLRVVAFANSFFERGGLPNGLSWWFKRAFKEFHFIWQPNCDDHYARTIEADVVICQTIERFLHVLPDN